ncbi:MAG: hypothetical protein HLUCCA01_03095 [Bacteroidetes bacterium HLUCCA01]|nr:MAG: hypothetical protein HLUCCA01_03095 [Bacteroidetes bacterium HLUCCA01]
MAGSSDNRAQSLDALRGLAILLMVLSGIVPFRVLPAWMYHAQLPPPTHVFDSTLAGLTWVDLVFPMFLFAMGAAIPLAMGRRIARGEGMLSLIGSLLGRGAMLAFFAIFLQHVRPYTLNPDPSAATWLTALGGFAALFMIYTAVPAAWSTIRRYLLRGAGLAAALGLLLYVSFPDGSGFKLTRSDIIIIVLANMAVFGGLVWLWTRENLLLRLGVMAVLLAAILSASVEDGWVHTLWNASPAPWVFRFYYLKYLFIIIPGMIAGEQLIQWQQSLREQPLRTWSTWQYAFLVGSAVALVLIALAGLQLRFSGMTFLSSVVVCLGMLALVRKAVTPAERTLRLMVQWAVFWLVLGLVFEPFEGGIKKDWSTWSYYFVTAGLSGMILIAFMIVLDVYRRQIGCRWLVENGQNPMLAYVGMMNLLYPVLGLTGLLEFIGGFTTSPLAGVVRAVIYTLLLAWIVALFRRKKLIWKA